VNDRWDVFRLRLRLRFLLYRSREPCVVIAGPHVFKFRYYTIDKVAVLHSGDGITFIEFIINGFRFCFASNDITHFPSSNSMQHDTCTTTWSNVFLKYPKLQHEAMYSWSTGSVTQQARPKCKLILYTGLLFQGQTDFLHNDIGYPTSRFCHD
jgi:hypothetical protein